MLFIKEQDLTRKYKEELNGNSNLTMEIKWRKHCKLYRLSKKCSIFRNTLGECDNCGHNKKIQHKIYLRRRK